MLFSHSLLCARIHAFTCTLISIYIYLFIYANVIVCYYSNVSEFSLTHACNANCSCTTISYDPICGANGLQYFSICHAGCTTSTLADGTPVSEVRPMYYP